MIERNVEHVFELSNDLKWVRDGKRSDKKFVDQTYLTAIKIHFNLFCTVSAEIYLLLQYHICTTPFIHINCDPTHS